MAQNQNKNLVQQIEELRLQKERLEVQELLTLQKAIESSDPDAIIKANMRWNDIQPRQESSSKSMLFDPYLFAQNAGYKDKIYSMSYPTLRRMATTPVIRAIVNTRIEQVAAFSEPQPDKHGIGFIIRRKSDYLENDKQEVSSSDKRKIRWITDFILNCGTTNNAWHGDSFDTFLRKVTRDSLELDQMTFEVVRNRKGQPIEYFATDSATYRYADSIDDEHYKGSQKEQINGYYPSYVQIHDGAILTEFYPWELCFGIRNHRTELSANGYGRSELEDLIQVVTWMLYGDSYNGKFFSQGSAPKGILKVSGNVNNTRLSEFRQQWQAMVQGVGNAHRTPVIESDKMEWIDLQKSNRDMEFQKWQEYLIQIACAIYKIAPEEVGFDVAGSGGRSMIDNSSNESQLQFSRDKGLRPLLKFLERKINKYIVNAIDPEFEFRFAGIDAESAKEELEADIKKGQSFMGYKELRRKHGLPEELDKGDVILNSAYLQSMQMSQMGNADSNAAMYDQYGEGAGTDEGVDLDAQSMDFDKGQSSNPLIDSLNKFLTDEIYND